jgi:hypothetical protein
MCTDIFEGSDSVLLLIDEIPDQVRDDAGGESISNNGLYLKLKLYFFGLLYLVPIQEK